MKYVYPAIFTPLEDGVFDVYVPDLPYVRTFGNSLAEAIEMAEDAISMWLWDAENNKEDIPQPSQTLSHEAPQFVSLVRADTEAYRKAHDNRAVKKTLSIPSWLNHKAEEANAPFSQILQEGLKKFVGTT
ncbi:MAG: type II toxin-antitoxin system HicB family antitoxin [Clostridiales bacterium]|jgi:predicted RNase H-like HicB family nuclease|nr:type II toxin-antitoxin system HicB family antitoxin [Clostridiales bacterium]